MAAKTFPQYCQLTFETEGGKLTAVLRPHCPGSSSGVTIGPGYDMKERTAADVKADLEAAGIPTDVADKLSGGVGKSGDTAKTWIGENFPGSAAVITTEASANLFTHVYPTYSELVRKKVSEEWLAPWDQLPLKMKEVLVDLAFRGDMSRFKGSATKHEKLIKPPVVANDFAAFKKLMTDYEYWQANTNLPKMKDGSANGRITARGKWLDGPDAPAGGGVHFPLDLGGGTPPSEASIKAYYEHTEIANKGGYFPIGANTVWHGGVHLRAKPGTPVRALWDGKLVAARLPDDPGKALQHYGSVSFVLVRHEVGGAVLNKLAPKGKLIGYKLRIANVNLRATASVKGDKLATLEQDDELERLDDLSPQADGYTWAKVKVKTAKTAANAGKQGFVAIKPEWYVAVREDKQVDKLDEAKTYEFFSLLMHLRNEPLDGSSKALDEARWLHAPPSTSSEALTGTVGASAPQPSTNAAADVKKVQARLTEHGAYAGAASGVCDAATQAAIGRFQDQLVKDKLIKAADGVISPGGKTWKALQAAPRGARPKLDKSIVDKLRAGKVVALDKPVRGGDVLWTSGEYGSSGYRTGLVHWEVFSKDNLAPGWPKVEDGDEDFNLDCAAIVGMVQQDEGWFDSDEVLTLDEIVRFYTTHPSAKLLRNYACKFISEWAIDLDVAIPKMLDANMVSTYGLKERMSPYLWWKEASDQKVALPEPKCWHYNPIAFASALASAAPPSSSAAESSASSDEHVFVVREGKKVPHYCQADSAWGARTLGDSATISAKGCAISSVSMILSYYGRSVTPLTMDEYLDDNDGYSGDSVKWEVAFKCGAVEGGVSFGARTVVSSGFKAVLDDRIAKNKPTLARVDYASDTDGSYNHFVVIVGRHKDGHWIMNDPASSGGNGAADPSDINLIEKTTRKTGYTLVQLDVFDPV
ncbi:pesticin C-terminus-like muramidase [Nannocystaceae bacterium ST9]